jgi:LysR family glycine cleavage system transcriptional activator
MPYVNNDHALSVDVAWFIDWLKTELEQDFPQAVIRA